MGANVAMAAILVVRLEVLDHFAPLQFALATALPVVEEHALRLLTLAAPSAIPLLALMRMSEDHGEADVMLHSLLMGERLLLLLLSHAQVVLLLRADGVRLLMHGLLPLLGHHVLLLPGGHSLRLHGVVSSVLPLPCILT